MRLRNRWGGPLRIVLALVLTLAAGAGADTFTVTRTDDPTPDGCLPADCSLREAVIDANADGLADAITLPAGIYTLAIAGADEDAAATGDLDITEDLTLEGAGARLTIIDGDAIDRVFDLHSSAGTVGISALTVLNGLSTGEGGGIWNRGVELTLARCSIANCTGASFGGGIQSQGSTTILESTISNNIGLRGGGISQWGGTLDIVNSTISDNTALSWGGGVSSSIAGTSVTLHNVTITGNIADGNANGQGEAGGIVVVNGEVTFTNTVVAGNIDLGSEAPDCQSVSQNPLTSNGYNLIGDTTGCQWFGDPTGVLTDVDPQLSPLANNGGPTDTHALQLGSPAIDAGNPAGCVDENDAPLIADQRGEPRPYDGDGDAVAVCDMGAYEVGPLVFADGFESGDTSAWSEAVP